MKVNNCDEVCFDDAIQGPPGKDGADGKDGKDGKDGADGKDAEVTLYDSTGNNTDGAMTQKATTDELNKKFDESNLPTYSGARLYKGKLYNPNALTVYVKEEIKSIANATVIVTGLAVPDGVRAPYEVTYKNNLMVTIKHMEKINQEILEAVYLGSSTELVSNIYLVDDDYNVIGIGLDTVNGIKYTKFGTN